MTHTMLFEKIVGKWAGSCRTWFEPGKLADESDVTGRIAGILNDRFVRHTYEGAMQGKVRQGEELIAFNKVTTVYQISWVDSFHTANAILFSEGKETERGFSVLGAYDIEAGKPKWAWRTEYDLVDDDHLTITAYNIIPGEEEAMAVQTTYHREK